MTTPSYIVGVDPGRTGAAVWLADDGRTVVRVERWVGADEPPALEILPGSVVAVEAIHVGRGRRSSIVLAEWAGGLVARLPPGVHVVRPQPGTWRAAVLGISRMTRADAKQVARQAATVHALGLPLPTIDTCEAWCLARYAWGVART